MSQSRTPLYPAAAGCLERADRAPFAFARTRRAHASSSEPSACFVLSTSRGASSFRRRGSYGGWSSALN
jgi:hypothetical protein